MKNYKYFIINNQYIFELKLNINNSDLILEYNYYKFINILDNIIDLINKNPEEQLLFNSINKELVMSNTCDIEQTILKIIKNIEIDIINFSNENELRKVIFPKCSIYLNKFHSNILLSFFKYIISSKNDIINQILYPNKKILPEFETSFIENNKITDLDEILNIFENNIIKYYIIKFVLSSKQKLEITESDNNKKTVSIIPPINIWHFSKSSFNDLQLILSIINSMNISKTEIIAKLKKIIVLILSYINNYDKFKNILYIQILLLYVHIIVKLLVNKDLEYTKPKISEQFTDNINNLFMKYFKSINSDNTITFKFINPILISEFEDVNYDEYISKYKYLLEISTSLYEKALLEDINENFSNIEKFNYPKLYPTKIFNIYTLLLDPNIDETSYFKYKKIQDHDNVITEQYYQLLYPMSVKPDITISKYFEIINNKIFKDIDSNIENYKLYPSTLYILEKSINSNIENDTPINIRFILLYKCVIPYIFDRYKIYEFIDSFF